MPSPVDFGHNAIIGMTLLFRSTSFMVMLEDTSSGVHTTWFYSYILVLFSLFDIMLVLLLTYAHFIALLYFLFSEACIFYFQRRFFRNASEL